MVDGPVSSRRFSRRQIRNVFMIGGGVIAALVIVIGGWQLYSSSSESAAVETQRQLDEFTKKQAQQISAPIAVPDKQLSALAQDPAVIALFSAADEVNLASAAADRLAQFESALKLRFILQGKAVGARPGSDSFIQRC